jgi:hypothetical protein
MGERMMIRSYRRVFEVDRRIYRVDRWALPVPGGVPLRGLAYFAASVVLVVLLARLPLVGAVLGAVSPPLRFVVLPLTVAVLATQATPDGRAAHRFARSWLGVRWRSRRCSAGRRVPCEGEPVPWDGRPAVRWDAETAQLVAGVARGPARVVFERPVRLTDRGGRLVASGDESGARGQAVVLCGGQELEVRP